MDRFIGRACAGLLRGRRQAGQGFARRAIVPGIMAGEVTLPIMLVGVTTTFIASNLHAGVGVIKAVGGAQLVAALFTIVVWLVARADAPRAWLVAGSTLVAGVGVGLMAVASTWWLLGLGLGLTGPAMAISHPFRRMVAAQVPDQTGVFNARANIWVAATQTAGTVLGAVAYLIWGSWRAPAGVLAAGFLALGLFQALRPSTVVPEQPAPARGALAVLREQWRLLAALFVAGAAFQQTWSDVQPTLGEHVGAWSGMVVAVFVPITVAASFAVRKFGAAADRGPVVAQASALLLPAALALAVVHGMSLSPLLAIGVAAVWVLIAQAGYTAVVTAVRGPMDRDSTAGAMLAALVAYLGSFVGTQLAGWLPWPGQAIVIAGAALAAVGITMPRAALASALRLLLPWRTFRYGSARTHRIRGHLVGLELHRDGGELCVIVDAISSTGVRRRRHVRVGPGRFELVLSGIGQRGFLWITDRVESRRHEVLDVLFGRPLPLSQSYVAELGARRVPVDGGGMALLGFTWRPRGAADRVGSLLHRLTIRGQRQIVGWRVRPPLRVRPAHAGHLRDGFARVWEWRRFLNPEWHRNVLRAGGRAGTILAVAVLTVMAGALLVGYVATSPAVTGAGLLAATLALTAMPARSGRRDLWSTIGLLLGAVATAIWGIATVRAGDALDVADGVSALLQAIAVAWPTYRRATGIWRARLAARRYEHHLDRKPIRRT